MSKEKKKVSAGKIVGLFFLFLFIIMCIIVNNGVNNMDSNNTETTKSIINVNDYFVNGTTTISKEELISRIGQPEKEETWNYTKANKEISKITSLYYENNLVQYDFCNNQLARIMILKDYEIEAITEDVIYPLFNATKFDITSQQNTGSTIVITNTSVHQIKFSYKDKTISNIIITFKDGIFD